MRRLLADIEAGKVDCVVVYKVDRLSRSLMDFTRVMQVFDRHKVSFVSVTQQFNTTHSMGRLTLNILLSFAQFEREIISERTRDKIAAARRKGKFAGGKPLLGYDLASSPAGAKLVVNEDEAHRVRGIYELYLEHQALIPTVKELAARGWANKGWITRKGDTPGRPAVRQDDPVPAADQPDLPGAGHLHGPGLPRRAPGDRGQGAVGAGAGGAGPQRQDGRVRRCGTGTGPCSRGCCTAPAAAAR